jgi:hypothetical protein
MAIPDANAIVRAYLAANAGLTAIVGTRIYCPRLPEDATLPALGFFIRGGTSSPYTPEITSPSFQFDCWANSSIGARALYRALYDALQGIQNVTVGSNLILGAREEVQGIDLVDVDVPNFFRVLCFFQIMIR